MFFLVTFSSFHPSFLIHFFPPLPKSRTIYLAHIHVISFFFFFFFSSQHSLIYLYSSSIFTPQNFSSSNPSSCCSSSLPFKLLASRLFLCWSWGSSQGKRLSWSILALWKINGHSLQCIFLKISPQICNIFGLKLNSGENKIHKRIHWWADGENFRVTSLCLFVGPLLTWH